MSLLLDKKKPPVINGDGKNQPWTSIGRLHRSVGRFYAQTTLIALVIAVVACGWALVESRKPHEIPVPVAQLANGRWVQAYMTTTPEEPGKVALLANWTGACWVGSADPSSHASRQCAALISNAPADGVLAQIQARTQEIVSKGLTVSLNVHTPIGSGYSYEVDWDERITDPQNAKTERVMKAYVELAFSPDHTLLHGDLWMNPYGMFVRKVTLIEVSR